MKRAWVRAGWLSVWVACLASAGFCGEDDKSVKLLYGFEPGELGASADPGVLEKHGWKFAGKLWKEGGTQPAWRVKDHLDELKLSADYDGPVTIYEADSSRDYPRVNLYRLGVTQGKYARRLNFGEGGWNYVKEYTAGKFTGLCAQPAGSGYHDIKDWFYQRYGNVFDSA